MVKKPSLTVVGPDAGGIPPPRKLGRDGAALWARVQGDYRIEDSGGIEMLTQCCEAADLIAQLDAAIQEDGPVIRFKSGVVRDHPALKHLLAHRAFVVRTLQRLGLDVEAIKPVGRPAGTFNRG